MALLDLDGVVYLGPEAVPGAPAAIAAATSAGMRMAYVTNNASRLPEAVALHLRELGVALADADVVTAAQAAARLLRERLPPGGRVLVVGAEGLVAAVQAAGLVVVAAAQDEPLAVVQGHSPTTTYGDLAEAALAVRAGALWVAANTDATLPSPRGPLPGNGAMVAALRTATGREPLVAGKPEPALHVESVERTAARAPLVVGDRLDTDIAGAVRVGCDSLLVLSGVTTPRELIEAPPALRPTYLGESVAALLEPGLPLAPAPLQSGWQVDRHGDGPLVLSGTGSSLEALRVLCLAGWAGAAIDRCAARGPAAEQVLADLGLAPSA